MIISIVLPSGSVEASFREDSSIHHKSPTKNAHQQRPIISWCTDLGVSPPRIPHLHLDLDLALLFLEDLRRSRLENFLTK
mmetsp:Transcript_7958/g.13847  ORF Transcript_7958/g.13847 Transcript_7958/m.13847 type:complete len:80 (+) Transcript_7958:1450-1689(+)